MRGKDVKGVGDEFYIGGIRESWCMGFYRYCGGGMHKGVITCTVQSGSLLLGDVVSSACADSSLETDTYHT